MASLQEQLLGDVTVRKINRVSSRIGRVLGRCHRPFWQNRSHAHRAAWWRVVEGIAKVALLVFTYTERPANELESRMKSWIQNVTPSEIIFELVGCIQVRMTGSA